MDPCPEGQTLCSDRCVDLSSDVSHCGECDAYCQPGDACVAGQCSTDIFRILALRFICTPVDATDYIDAHMGPLAISGNHLFSSGENLVLRYDISGNTAQVAGNSGIPTLTYDIAQHQMWALGDEQGWTHTAGSSITHIIPVEHPTSLNVAAGTPRILSESFVLPPGSGLFAGLGILGVHTGTEFIVIDVATGEVTRRSSPPLSAAACQGPFFFGLIEQRIDGLMLVYVQDGTDAIVRTRPVDGVTQVVEQAVWLGDMCGIVINTITERWCTVVSERSQFDNKEGQTWAVCCWADLVLP